MEKNLTPDKDGVLETVDSNAKSEFEETVDLVGQAVVAVVVAFEAVSNFFSEDK